MDRYKLHEFFAGKATIDCEREVLDWMEATPANRQEFIRERLLYNAVLLHSGGGVRGVVVKPFF